MARLVVFRGVQYDADRLPPHVDASACVPIDQWFAENRVVPPTTRRVDPAPPAATPAKPRRVSRPRKS